MFPHLQVRRARKARTPVEELEPQASCLSQHILHKIGLNSWPDWLFVPRDIAIGLTDLGVDSGRKAAPLLLPL